VWSQRDGASAARRSAVPYSFAGIERCRQVIVEGEIMWQRFFALNAIAPVQVIFEQLTSDYSGEVRDTLQRIRPGVADVDAPAPTSRRQADGRSIELLADFTADRARRTAAGRLRVPSVLRRAVRRARPRETR